MSFQKREKERDFKKKKKKRFDDKAERKTIKRN